MKLNIKATNFDLTAAIKKAVEDKILSLDKFIPYTEDSVEAFVEVALETRHHKKGEIYYAEANIKVPGRVFRSESKKEDLYQAINEVKDELQRILKKHKGKKIVKRKKA